MKWSVRLFSVSGIPVLMHWTFLLLLAWILYANLAAGQTFAQALKSVGFVLALFACVVLHELGHVFAARRYGIGTRDVTLLPIGGLARLERMPDDPKQELVVAAAGPMVNVVIAAVLYVVLAFDSGLATVESVKYLGQDFLTHLLWVNVILVLFNLLPAFPMDGGRMLRALLATRMPYVRATNVAANVGQMMAILFGLLGLFTNPFLLFIAIFVFLGAQAEAQHTEVRSMLRDVLVRDAMLSRFQTLSPRDSLGSVVEKLLASDQQDFPVVDGERIVGVLPRVALMRTLAESGLEAEVASAMQADVEPVSETDRVSDVFNRMRERGLSIVPVVRGGRLVGVLNLENITEWMMIHRAIEEGEAQDTPSDVLPARG